MGVAFLRAPVCTQSTEPPQNFGHGSSLLVNCYLEIKFHKKKRSFKNTKLVGFVSGYLENFWLEELSYIGNRYLNYKLCHRIV